MSVSLAVSSAYIFTFNHSCLSGRLSCIATSMTSVQAIQVNQVQAVVGSAVCDNHLVNQVSVVQLTQVKLIHSFCCQSLKNNLHLVTVGAVATVIVTSAGLSLLARVDLYQLSNVCAIII